MTDDADSTQRKSKRRPTVDQAVASDRERQALELRKAGATFDQIAKQLGYADPSGAHRAITRAIDRIPDQAVAEYRKVDVERLDRLLLAVWQQALAGDLKALDRALRVLDQRARLLGLNTPAKSEIDVTVTERSASDVALDELVAEMERRATAERAVTPPS